MEEIEVDLKKKGVPRKIRRAEAWSLARLKVKEMKAVVAQEQALIPGGATGSTTDFGSVDVGSSPTREAKIEIVME